MALKPANQPTDSELRLLVQPADSELRLAIFLKGLPQTPDLKKNKLRPANYAQRDADEGAGLQNFLKKSNDIYDTNHNKVGKYYDGNAYFLPDHYNPKISWTMSKMDPLSKN